MHSILIPALLVFGQAVEFDDAPPTVWIVDSQVLSCSPDTLSASDTLVLGLGPRHGRELAIRRVADNTWYFLVVGLAPDDVPQLMSPEDFASATRVEIPASFETRAWAVGAAVEPVLKLPGVYEVHVSENLESEDGGYSCSFSYTAESPNCAFQRNTPAGAGVSAELGC